MKRDDILLERDRDREPLDIEVACHAHNLVEFRVLEPGVMVIEPVMLKQGIEEVRAPAVGAGVTGNAHEARERVGGIVGEDLQERIHALLGDPAGFEKSGAGHPVLCRDIPVVQSRSMTPAAAVSGVVSLVSMQKSAAAW